jgi:hypothetical protein
VQVKEEKEEGLACGRRLDEGVFAFVERTLIFTRE